MENKAATELVSPTVNVDCTTIQFFKDAIFTAMKNSNFKIMSCRNIVFSRLH